MPCAAGELCALRQLTPVAERCAMRGWGGAQLLRVFVTPVVVMHFKRSVSYSSSDVCALFSPRDTTSNLFSYFFPRFSCLPCFSNHPHVDVAVGWKVAVVACQQKQAYDFCVDIRWVDVFSVGFLFFLS